MKKTVILSLSALLLMSGCGTYAGSGAYVGASFGSILGSAVGGLSGGGRGSDIGTIVGTVGGAVIGGAIGGAKDAAGRQEVRDHYERVMSKKDYEQSRQSLGTNEEGTSGSGFDPTNSGDDRLFDFDGPDYTEPYTAAKPVTVPPLQEEVKGMDNTVADGMKVEIRNARFVDESRDSRLSSKEVAKIIFELVNTSPEPIIDLQPVVMETTRQRRIYISPNIHIERLDPGKVIRYTAMIQAGKLKNGTLTFRLTALEGNAPVADAVELKVEATK